MHDGAHMTWLAQRISHRLRVIAFVINDEYLRANVRLTHASLLLSL